MTEQDENMFSEPYFNPAVRNEIIEKTEKNLIRRGRKYIMQGISQLARGASLSENRLQKGVVGAVLLSVALMIAVFKSVTRLDRHIRLIETNCKNIDKNKLELYQTKRMPRYIDFSQYLIQINMFVANTTGIIRNMPRGANYASYVDQLAKQPIFRVETMHREMHHDVTMIKMPMPENKLSMPELGWVSDTQFLIACRNLTNTARRLKELYNLLYNIQNNVWQVDGNTEKELRALSRVMSKTIPEVVKITHQLVLAFSRTVSSVTSNDTVSSENLNSSSINTSSMELYLPSKFEYPDQFDIKDDIGTSIFPLGSSWDEMSMKFPEATNRIIHSPRGELLVLSLCNNSIVLGFDENRKLTFVQLDRKLRKPVNVKGVSIFTSGATDILLCKCRDSLNKESNMPQTVAIKDLTVKIVNVDDMIFFFNQFTNSLRPRINQFGYSRSFNDVLSFRQ